MSTKSNESESLMKKAGTIAAIIIQMAKIEKVYDMEHPPKNMNANNGTIIIFWDGKRIHGQYDHIIPSKLTNDIKKRMGKNTTYISNQITLTASYNNEFKRYYDEYKCSYEVIDDEFETTQSKSITLTHLEVENMLTNFQYLLLSRTDKSFWIADADQDLYYNTKPPKINSKIDNSTIKYYTRLGLIKSIPYHW